MRTPESAHDSRGSHHWEYRVSRGEHLGSILDRIRQTPGEDLLLNISDHDSLRTDGALRRALAAAASELGKRVTFSLVEGHPSGAETPAQPPAVPRPSWTVPGDRGARGSPPSARIPVTVVRAQGGERVATARDVAIAVGLPRLSRAGRRIAFTFAFLAGLLTTAAVVFLVPRAEVTITPVVEPVSSEFTIRASASVQGADPGSAILPAHIVVHEEHVERVVPVEHTVERGDQARGVVQLVNRTAAPQRIKTGSRLQAESGVVLRLETSAVIPPEGTVDVPVVADDGGAKGNLTDGRLTFLALPQDARAVLFGRVVEPLTGGTDRPVRTLGEEDVRRATEHLLRDFRDPLWTKVSASAPQDALKEETLFRLIVSDVGTQEPVGSEAAEFHLRGILRGELFAVSEAAYVDLLRSMVRSRIGEGKTLGRPLTAAGARVGDVRWDEGTADISIRVENIAHTEFDLPHLRERLMGRTAGGALEYLQALPGVKDAHVAISPFWVRRVPGVPRNVQMTLKLPEPAGQD